MSAFHLATPKSRHASENVEYVVGTHQCMLGI